MNHDQFEMVKKAHKIVTEEVDLHIPGVKEIRLFSVDFKDARGFSLSYYLTFWSTDSTSFINLLASLEMRGVEVHEAILSFSFTKTGGENDRNKLSNVYITAKLFLDVTFQVMQEVPS